MADTVLTVDLSSTLRPVTHAASGSLYGVTEKLPADVDAFIAPLHPKVFNNPAADAQQPVGDAIAVAGRVAPTGGRVSIRLADWFPGWPYKFSNMSDWLDKVGQTVSRKQASGLDNYYGYEIWNEPNGTWTSSTSFTDFWKQTYAKLRQLDPNAKIIGPSVAGYDRNYLQTFLTFAKNNNCLPDIVCWHELSGGNFTANFASYRALEQQLGIGPLPISINEYSNKDTINDEGQPGASAPLIAKFERFQVDSACISYWDVAHAGRLGSLLATDTDKNGGWWFYKWYGDMTGSMVSTTPPSPNDAAALDGFANVDSAAGTASVVFAGVNDGAIQVVVKGFAAALFRSKVHAIVEHTPFASRSTIVKATDMVSVADLNVENDQITVSVSNTNGTDGYRLSLSSIGGTVGSGGSGSSGDARGSGGASGSGGDAAQRGGDSGAGGVAAGAPGGSGVGLATGGAGKIGGLPAISAGTGGGPVSVLGDMGNTGHRGGCACSLSGARARGPSWVAPWLAALLALMRRRRRRHRNAAKGVLLAALLVTLGCSSSNASHRLPEDGRGLVHRDQRVVTVVELTCPHRAADPRSTQNAGPPR